ncbi:biotinidase isoform 2-T2 [Synchiropus picturatus]
MFLRALFLAALTLSWSQTEASLGSTYTAAVYEHHPVLNPQPWLASSRLAALQHVKKNLDVYEEQAALAAQQGAQILVFPEDGLQGFKFSRSSISSYLESIPDPQQETWNPCTEPGRHDGTEVLQRLSCMARRNGIYLVANMADVQPCPLPSDPSAPCPPDGHWQFNTNVVFRYTVNTSVTPMMLVLCLSLSRSSEGALVARYHKNNLYFEAAFDAPPRPEVVTFETPFAGKFGLITCFDILFDRPTLTLLEQGVRQLIFPAAWMNQLPLLDLIQFQRAFSLGSNITLLSPNIRSDALLMTGSGIYWPSGAVYHHARLGDPEEGKLLVASVPLLEPLGQNTSEIYSSPAPGYCRRDGCPASPPYFTSTMMHDPFKFVLLSDLEGELGVCDGAFCCHLQYTLSPQEGDQELYALGVFAGTHTVNGRYAVQDGAGAAREPGEDSRRWRDHETRKHVGRSGHRMPVRTPVPPGQGQSGRRLKSRGNTSVTHPPSNFVSQSETQKLSQSETSTVFESEFNNEPSP